MNKTKLFITLFVIAIIAFVVILATTNKKQESKPLSTLAQCIGTTGAKFYGAYWCPHCQKQKQIFKGAAKDLPYIECAKPEAVSQTCLADLKKKNPDENSLEFQTAARACSQYQTCIDQDIQGYPTWKFPQPISLTSTEEISECPAVYDPTQPPGCRSITAGFKGWIVKNKTETIVVESPEKPKKLETGAWSFLAGTNIGGEVEPAVLGEATNCAFTQ